MKPKTNFQITIGYKAVICVNVMAENEKEAKAKAIEIFKNRKDKVFKSQIDLQDDTFDAYGCVDLDQTWNIINN